MAIPRRPASLRPFTPPATKPVMPVDSGYYIVGLNAGQCAAKKAGAYGCKFDANDNPTECGAIAVNDATGEVTVAAVK
jgi:hypothetical protein